MNPVPMGIRNGKKRPHCEDPTAAAKIEEFQVIVQKLGDQNRRYLSGRTTHLCKPSMFTHGLLVPDPLQGSTCLTQPHRSGRQVGSGTERHSGRGGVRLGVSLELLRGYYKLLVVK